MPKILITTSSFEVASNEPLRTLEKSNFEIALNPHGRRLTEDEVGALLQDDVAGMIAGVEPLTRAVLERAKGLRVISRCGIGMDSVDQMAAKELGILIFNTPGAPVSAVAELTIALMLDLLRKVSQADRSIRDGRWKQLMGNLLEFQTVGIIGYGRIGRKVGSLLRAFGARVLVHDAMGVSVPAGVEACSLRELLEQSDITTLHVPFDDSTRHLINRESLALMKPGSLLVNASRGGLIDEDALLAALQSGHLGGAGLDAFEMEPYEGPLRSLPQVVMTCHMGSYARESRIQMEREAGENLFKGLAAAGIFKGAE